VSTLGKNTINVGEGCGHMSLKGGERKFSTGDEVIGSGNTDKRRLLGWVGQRAHCNSSALTPALGLLFQSTAVASRGREEDIVLLPSHKLREAIRGTWYSN